MISTPEAPTTTRLIHRGERNAVSWWQTAAVCDIPGAFDDADLLTLVQVLPVIKDIGYDAILVRPSFPNIEQQRSELTTLAKSCHNNGLRLLVRVGNSPAEQTLAPADSPPLLELEYDNQLLIERTRQAVESGADGIDLGMIDDAPNQPDARGRANSFSMAVNQQLAATADLGASVILTAEVTRLHPEFYMHHLTEDWFHHLRDDGLFSSPWDTRKLRLRIQETYSNHDPLGQTVAWRPSLTDWTRSPGNRGIRPGSWEDGATPGRFDAMMMFIGSLPGAIYLPFVRTGGNIWVTSSRPPELRVSLGEKPRDRFRRGLTGRMLGLRKQNHLGTCTLAFVDGLNWAHTGVSVHLSGSVLVVLNASSKPVTVPAEHTLLLYSSGFSNSDERGTVIEPDTCGWFDPAQARPVDPGNYKGPGQRIY